MRLIIAVISAFKLDAVCEALESIGVHGITLTEVTGTGKQLASMEFQLGAKSRPAAMPKLRLELAVPDAIADRAIQTIIHAARTGKVGDGKIFVTAIDQAIRIRDGRKGPAAL